MSHAQKIQSIAIVTACMTSWGQPAFVLSEFEVTQEEMDNGVHYDLAEKELLRQGYEEPCVHFAATESPSFLHPAVREHLCLPSIAAPSTASILSEEP